MAAAAMAAAAMAAAARAAAAALVVVVPAVAMWAGLAVVQWVGGEKAMAATVAVMAVAATATGVAVTATAAAATVTAVAVTATEAAVAVAAVAAMVGRLGGPNCILFSPDLWRRACHRNCATPARMHLVAGGTQTLLHRIGACPDAPSPPSSTTRCRLRPCRPGCPPGCQTW